MPGLMGHLLDMDHEGHVRLAAAWGLPRDEASAAALYAQMTDPWSVAGVLEGLPPRARLVLDTLAAAGRQGLDAAELNRRLPLRVEDQEQTMATLVDFGLARPLRVDERTYVVADETAACLEILAHSAATADPSTTPLRGLLESLSAPELRRLAERWGIGEAQTRLRRELLADLEVRLTSRDSARRASAAVSSSARSVLVALVRSGGRLTFAQVKEKAKLEETAARAAARELAEVFLARPSLAGATRALFVPLGVGTQDLEAMAPAGPEATPVGGPPLPPPRFALLCDLLTVLAQLRDGRARPSRLPLSDAQRRRLVPFLRDQGAPAGPRMAFLLALARGLNLVGEDGTASDAGERLTEWEQSDFPAQTAAAFAWWLSSERWREGLTQGERDTGGPLALGKGRRRLIERLGECESGKWYSLAEFIARLRAQEPLLFREREALLVYGGQGALERAARFWERWDGKVARGALTLALRWLEIVEVADVDGVTSFALTPLGAWVLGRPGAERPSRPEGPSLAEEEEGVVRVLWPDGPVIAGLLAFARPLAGEIPLFRVERQTVVEAVGRAIAAEAMLGTLARGGLASSALGASLRKWTAAVVRLGVTRGLVLTAEDERALDALLLAPGNEGLRLRRLGPRHALVGDEEEFDRALDRLRAGGFLFGAPSAGRRPGL